MHAPLDQLFIGIYLTDQVISMLGATANQEAEVSNFSVEPRKSLTQDTHEKVNCRKVNFTIKVAESLRDAGRKILFPLIKGQLFFLLPVLMQS